MIHTKLLEIVTTVTLPDGREFEFRVEHHPAEPEVGLPNEALLADSVRTKGGEWQCPEDVLTIEEIDYVNALLTQSLDGDDA